MRLEVEATCPLGEKGNARALAGAFQAAFPRSPHLPAVVEPCDE